MDRSYWQDDAHERNDRIAYNYVYKIHHHSVDAIIKKQTDQFRDLIFHAQLIKSLRGPWENANLCADKYFQNLMDAMIWIEENHERFQQL